MELEGMYDWQRFDESFDSVNGGVLYVSPADGSSSIEPGYALAGVMWMDAIGNEKPYFAFVAEFSVDRVRELTGSEAFDAYEAADAFDFATDPDVAEEIGFFDDIETAIAAVEEACEPR